METRNSSSPKSVKSQLSPEEVKELDQAKDELFIRIYKKRESYFPRWREVTLKYLAAIERGMERAEKYHEGNIADVIKKYAEKIKKRRDAFIKKYPFETADDNKTIRYLDGLDELVKPLDRLHRRALIRKQREYCAKNQRLNPDTRIPQEVPASQDDIPSGDATQQAEESSCEDEQVLAAEDWKSEVGDSDTES